MSQQQLNEIALAILTTQYRDLAHLRFKVPDLSMEAAIKQEAQQKGVDYTKYLPVDLAKKVTDVISTGVGNQHFNYMLAKWPEAIIWEARHLVYGSELTLLSHPEVQKYLEDIHIEYIPSNLNFTPPTKEAEALRGALFSNH